MIDNLKLLAGLPIEINGIKIYSPSLMKIAEVGETEYYNMLSLLCFDIEDLENYEQLKKEFPNVKPFDIVYNFCINDEKYSGQILNTLKFFLKQEIYIDKTNGVFYTKDLKIIDRNIFAEIANVLKIQNNIEKPKNEEYNPANNKAKELINKINKLKKQVPKSKDNIDLHSIISGVIWKSGNINEIWNLTIYQLFDAYRRLDIVDNYSNIMYGIYSGNIDSKKINQKDIFWSIKIKNKED